MNQKNVSVKHIENFLFVGKGDSNHWVTMDAPSEAVIPGASSPMEMMLLALAGCTGSDVAAILKKKRITFDLFELLVSGERAEEHPKIYTKIHITYKITGKNIPEKDVQRAVELSRTKYCSVSAMLEKSAAMTDSIEIVNTAE